MKRLRRYFVGVALFALILVPGLTLAASAVLGEVTWTTGNGNTYVVVKLQGANWDEARADVESFLPGYHLATITSQDEQDFIDGFLINEGFTSQYWLGGFQITPKPEADPAAGWEWVTGEPWEFTNWLPPEPNNAGGIEDHLAMNPFLGWNDEGTAIGSVFGYIAECESSAFFPYIGDPVPGIILNTELAPGSGGSAGVIQTGGLTPGVEAFIDRSGQQWQAIPVQMIGADFIQTAQNNADYPYIGIDVTVATGTILHMLVPENDDFLPFEWMNEPVFGSDWINTGAVIVTSWSSPAQVWSTFTPLPAGTYRFRELPNDRSFYGIAATQAGVSVLIDIKPGNKRNKINPRSKGRIWVAVLANTDNSSPFDPSSQVDIPTVEFGPDGAKVTRYKVRDINKDGLGDLLLGFKIRRTGIACGDTEATLTGETYDGLSFTGSDSIRTVGCKP